MSLIVSILILLVAARLAAELAERLGQPAMIGEIVAGLVLGPSVLHMIARSPALDALSDLGVLLLALLAGMEIDLPHLAQAFLGRNVWVSIVGFALPLGLGAAVGLAFHMDSMRALFVGLCSAITALPVSIRILMDLGRLTTDVGRRIVSAAIANDVLALLVLGIVLGSRTSSASPIGEALVVLTAALKIVVFMTAVVGVSRAARLVSHASPGAGSLDVLLSRLKVKEPLFAVTLLFVLGFAALAEVLGLHFVVGAFFGAVLLTRDLLGPARFEDVRQTASGITMGLLAPLFFASIGLEFNARSLTDVPLIAAVLVTAFAGKILAGRLGGRLAGLTPTASWTLGLGMNGRGMMELVVANIALANGFIGERLFSILVLMGVVTTLVTPPLLKWAFERLDRAPERHRMSPT
jgi:Kef-type K+ transport system membrane component KefB